ncbi:hypothetical protein Hypma_001008 [Hypsizygus marmoreus]|uniref:Uncharacterized protein n=1 Tax=Hypsizygus marmoreus TaxID=39966 RepID=A0A369JAB0_HYPMA|nr:hypothetical protein Hypma_001008 [Hypsizygus marmoreus]
MPVQSNAATQEGGSFESLFEERRKLHDEEYKVIRQSDMAKNPHKRLAVFREARALQPQINELNRKITSMLVQGPKNK